MPMYEKGSVRAEPRSKQQERMKKIMKKFLSSLLALTMILSLVIVPANANETQVQQDPQTPTLTGFSVRADKTKVPVGTEVTFTVSGTPNLSGVTDATIDDTKTTYTWHNATATTENGTTAKATVSSDSLSVYCEVTVTYKVGEGADQQIKQTTDSVTVTKDTFDYKDFSVVVNGKEYDAAATVDVDIIKGATLGTVTAVKKSGSIFDVKVGEFNTNEKTLSVSAKYDGKDIAGSTKTVKINVNEKEPSVTLTPDTTLTVRSGQSVNLTATYKLGSDTPSNRSETYRWSVISPAANQGDFTSYTSKNTSWKAPAVNSETTYKINCTVTDDGVSTSAVTPVTIKVTPDTRHAEAESYRSVMPTTSTQTLSFKFTDSSTSPATDLTSKVAAVDWKVSPASAADFVGSHTGTSVTLRSGATAVSSLSVTAKFTYDGVPYEVTFSNIKISALEADLDAIENGKTGTYSRSELKSAAQTAINSQYSHSSDYETVESITPPVLTSSSTLGTLSTADFGSSSSGYITFDSKKGAIGNAKITLTATAASGRTYTVTLNIPVTPIKTTYESQYPQPSGTSSNYKYSVDVPDGFYSYYVVAKNPSKAPTDYSEKLSGTKSSYSGSSLYTLSGSDFDKSSGKCELYVVTYEKNDDTAYCGVITVYQKSYNIEYGVVAGESVTFAQKHFESFLEEIADDAGDYNSRKDTLELSYVKFSLPNSTREGVLYEGKSKIDRNDKVEDLDKVTFESVAKAKDTITIPFTAYGKLYKDGASKGKDVDYSGNVVISVVKEDIVFEVGVNSAVKLGSDKFIDFLRDSDKSYKKADLDYVTFDVGRNSAITSYFNGTGALYRYYNGNTGINSTVSAKDEFYYNPKTSSKHYDLDDVTYVTSKFAKVGDIVYIPFTAYGTKSGQKAEGTLAIKVKQTMNFVDVNPGDFFYQPVQWAVNEGITNGTSSTTFSPYKNCNRAEIVTFLWRAAKSPEPTITRNPFSDVQSVRDASYYKAILWASQNGITAGTTATTFSPYQECTRSQIVTFLYRYAKATNTTTSNPFKDVSSVNEASYYNAILWAVGKGITQGTSTTTFSPYASCTRGEAVTFLYRYVNGVK